MGETNKTYRIHTEVGVNTNLTVKLDQDYSTFEILSLKLTDVESYKTNNADYGIVVGRVIANNGFGIENAKVSIFISADGATDTIVSQLYPYSTTSTQDKNGVKYNLLSDEQVNDCHQVVGTFPQKTYMLDNDSWIEVFDRYYKYTSRTNHAGDYMICGVPVGQHILHMDLDISDCGILSQRPRDLVYKGYTIEQFMNPNQFKTGTDLGSLTQIHSQDMSINVIPFWGDINSGESLGLTRADFNVSYTFEPTCVFIGSLVGDNASNGISKKCIATENMGAMDELVTGEGTIEMIRKTVGGNVEEFQVKGTQLINGDGVWCYQIPMNLDYVKHDEYGNIIPTNNTDQGIPTRARVRFRVSMNDFEANTNNYFRAKVLVPHNPQEKGEVDYNFGSATKETSYRDLFWNNVYTVKSYIPRFQKSQNFRDRRFTGIKHCNIYGQNNPMPYNNIAIKLPLMFTILCALIKSYVRIVTWINTVVDVIADAIGQISTAFPNMRYAQDIKDSFEAHRFKFITLADGLCPDLDGWYFAPTNADVPIACAEHSESAGNEIYLSQETLEYLKSDEEVSGTDKTSIDYTNKDDNNSICLTMNVDYLLSCIEMNLAQEYKVINFDFYNDWINGTIYMPRWMRFVRKKKTFLFGTVPIVGAIKGCTSTDSDGLKDSKLFSNDYRIKAFLQSRRYTQQCKLAYKIEGGELPSLVGYKGCGSSDSYNQQVCHRKKGLAQKSIFGATNGGIVHNHRTLQNQFVYYFKPCEWEGDGRKVNLFANDIVLLGSLNDCSIYGVPQAFKYLSSSSFKMPTNLALTNMEDNGYLYTNNGTICSGNEAITSTGVTIASQTLESYKDAYAGSSSEITLDKTSYEDYIPLTEAAGISWNYNGPDQGESNYGDNFYQPGGHFLGLSCINSQTNLKTCINLERICEEGVGLSQRQEVPRNRIGKQLSYKYLVPTGLISNDEIMGVDFRTMYATMNHNRLLCTSKKDEKTTYLVYDFTYMRPNAFDGVFGQWLSGNTMYNKNLKEGEDFQVEDEFLSRYGVLYDKEEADDVKANTWRRTIESKSTDYYMFRLGLDDLEKSTQLSKYFYGGETDAAMPQYENSFYFYFGLRHGATALDEFNKQFFATCESKKIQETEITPLELDITCSTTSTILKPSTQFGVKFGAYFIDGTAIPDNSLTVIFEGDGSNYAQYEKSDKNGEIGVKNTNTTSKEYNITLTMAVLYNSYTYSKSISITLSGTYK